MVRLRRRLTACLLALPALVALPARAGTPLLIWPIDPVIAPGQQAAALWLENHGAEPAVLQVRIFGWTQAGDETYQPQATVLPSPPIATIAPGGRQLVRLIATQPAPAGAEQPYRIFIDELPTPGGPADAAPGTAVRLQLRYAVPLFVYGAGAVPPLTRTRDGVGALDANAMAPRLDWNLVLEAGKPVLVLRNSGNARARITAVEWQAPGGAVQTLNPGLLGYVLAGSSMRFPIDRPLPRNAALRAQLNGRPADIPRAPD